MMLDFLFMFSNENSAYQVYLNRQIQERMSNTAHQREVKDLRSAGLNPVLCANRAASLPARSVAPAFNTAKGVHPSMNSAFAYHIEQQSLQQQLQLQRAQIAQIYASANTAKAQAALNLALYKKVKASNSRALACNSFAMASSAKDVACGYYDNL